MNVSCRYLCFKNSKHKRLLIVTANNIIQINDMILKRAELDNKKRNCLLGDSICIKCYNNCMRNKNKIKNIILKSFDDNEHINFDNNEHINSDNNINNLEPTDNHDV
jgi:hypothetical protein